MEKAIRGNMANAQKRKPSRSKKRQRKTYLFCAVMCLPAIYGIAKYLITNTYSVLLAFTLGEPFKDPWSLENFSMFWTNLTSSGGELAIAFSNTLKYFAVGLIKAFLSYVIAYFIYKKVPGAKFFRFLFFLPCIISPIITVAIFKDLIREGGPLWTVVRALFGVEYEALLAYPETATTTIIVYSFLSGFGSTYLIYVGAMNRIPQEIIEAGRLDGVSTWREFWSIIFPLTWGTFSTFLLMSCTTLFTASGPILYFTNGAADTSTLGFYLFNSVKNGTYNYPSAIGLVLTLLTVPIVVIVRLIIKKLDAGVEY